MRLKNLMVVGFAFNETQDSVILMQKHRPDNQKGFINGIGGHVERGETSQKAMAREFEEETGVEVPLHRWIRFATLIDLEHEAWLSCFKVFLPRAKFSTATQTTDEPIFHASMDALFNYSLLNSCKWLIPMACYTNIEVTLKDFDLLGDESNPREKIYTLKEE